MIIVSKSKVRCDKCKEDYDVEWDLELVESTEKQMGYNNLYVSEIVAECPYCGEKMNLELQASEYPEGTLEYMQIKGDSLHSHPMVEEPEIRFYDL